MTSAYKYLLPLLAIFLAFPVIAHEGYHYAGVTNTAPTANQTYATLVQREAPSCSWCHTLGWAVLWDSDSSGQYAEAGIGYSSWWRTPHGSAHLWYATKTENLGVTVGKVALGIPVKISIVKNTDQTATITWSWEECKRNGMCSSKQIVKTVGVPGWTDQNGIHPTKMEVYSSDGSHPSACFDFTNVAIYADDVNASLQNTDPYFVASGSTLQNFSISYNCKS